MINSSNAACNEPAERQFGVRHGLSGHWLSDRHKALLYQQITCFVFKNLETSLAAWSHKRTGFTLMMLYLIHPDHRDDRGCWRMSGTVIELACFPDVERPDSHRRVSSRISTADWTVWEVQGTDLSRRLALCGLTLWGPALGGSDRPCVA